MKKIKGVIKNICRKYLGYDPCIIRIKIENDFLDQKKLLSNTETKVIFDIGTNVGQTTWKYRKLFRSADIYGFEPFPDVFNIYKKTFEYDKKIHPRNMAISNNDGESIFFVNNNNYTNSLLPINLYNHEYTSNFKPESKMRVNTRTLDSVCAEMKIDRIDILKLDIQGGELLALSGAQEMLKQNKISLIYSEVEFSILYENQPLYKDIERFLSGFGYKPYKTYNVSISESGEPISADVIFINSN